MERIGSVAYKLQLPESTSIYPIFHVSQLKTAVPTSHQVSVLPQALEGLQIPVKILQRRVSTSDHTIVPQVLVQWSNLPRSLATWEDLEELKQKFPRAPAWGQAGLRRGGDVSNQDAPTKEADAVTMEPEAPEPRREVRTR
jgi:hypothetical protein